MELRIKVDEDLPVAVVDMLREAGYEAYSVLEQGMSGWKDLEIWQAVQVEGQFLITADKGFADIRNHPLGTHAGILLLRPDRDGIEPVVELMRDVLAACSLDSLLGTVSVVTPRGLRVRRANTP